MASIADIFVTVLPETSEIAPKIKAAFRAVDKDAAEAGRRWRGEIERELKDVKATVKVDAETARARAEIDEVARDRRSTIHVDIDKSGIDSLTTSLGGLGSAGGGGGGISGMAAGIAGLIPVASALTGALGLIPAALGGAGLAAGTLITGLSGVKDAYTAVGDASKSANKDQKEKTEAVASATRELQSAVRSEASAQQDVANARKDARQQLDDLNLSLQGGKIDEAQAYNNLLKARRDLATGTFKDQLDYNDAVLRVDSATQTFNESIQRNTELQSKANDAQSKGVDNADNVVAANGRLQQTHEQVAVAQGKVTEATNSTSTAQQKAIDSMAELSPVAQTLVNTLQGMKPVWDQLKFAVQDKLFAGVGQEIQGLAQTYMPMLTTVMSSMAGTMNQTFGQIAAVLQSPAGIAGVKSLFDNLAKAFQAFMPAIPVLVQGFGQLAQVGSGFLPQLGAAFTQAAQGFTQFISQAAASGQLQQWISTGIQAMSMLGNITQTVFKAFLDLGPLGTAIISALDQTLTALAPAIPPLATAFTALVTAITPILPAVASLVAQLVGALAPSLTAIFNAMAPVIQQWISAVMPLWQQMMPIVAQLASQLGGALVQAIQQIGPLLPPLVAAFGQFMVNLAPLLPQIMDLAVKILPVFTTAVSLSLQVLTKVFELLSWASKNVLPMIMNTVSAFGQIWTTVFDGVKAIVKDVWDFIKPIFDNIKGFLEELPGPLKDLIGLHDGKGAGAVLTSPKGGGFVPKGGSTPSGFDWNAVAGAESSGNWFDNNSGGHSTSSGAPRGGLQITDGTWRSYGGTEFAPTANLATPEQQKTVADRIAFSGYAGQPPQGLGAWEAITKGMVPGVTASTPAPSIAAPPVPVMPGVPASTSAYAAPAASDQALLANVPAGTYSQTGNADLTKGLGDCSSAIEDLINIMQGKPTAGRSMSTINEAQWLTDRGFVSGMGGPGDFRVGFNKDHTQATLPGGTPFNWGSNSAAANRGIGGTGADDPAFTSHYYLPGGGAPMSANMPMGTPQAPFYMAPAPGQINGTGQNNDATKQLGQNVGGDLWEMFGIPGVTNPKDMGITKFFTGLLSGALGMNLGGGKGGGMPASYYASGGGDGAAMPPMGGGGGGLDSLLGLATSFMPGMPGGNSTNIADMAQFKAPGVAGPGNTTIDQSMTFNGAPTPQESSTMYGQWSSQNRYPALQQHLPGQG